MAQPDVQNENPKLTALRTALAANRGMELLSQITRDAESTVEHDEVKRVSYLTDLFIRIHTDMFQDWKQQNAHRPGDMPDAHDRDAVRNTMLNVLCANGDNGGAPKGLFDTNGYVIYHDQQHVAEVLASFYDKMRDIKPYGYGNELTLDFFMVALGKLPAFQEVYPAGIDLRRLDSADIQALHEKGNIVGVERAFGHAMDPTRTPPLKNMPNGFGKWEKHVEYVSGIQFLSHQKGDEKFLVTVNGGLVSLDEVKPRLENFLKSDSLLADFPPISSNIIKGYLPGTESLREAGKNDIDGIAVSADAAPLVCLDTNILTGMRSPAHKILMGMIEQCRGKNASVFTLANNPTLKSELLNVAGDPKRRRIIELAYNKLSRVTAKMDEVKEEIFAGKNTSSQPKLYVSMGGAGSGKTGVEELARAQCGDDGFVVASLDEFRKKSDLYKVMTAANHHGDDYVAIEPFANTLRQWVADTAKERRVNILYDGTGVVYQPRYAKVVESFKNAGFHTSVAAVDTALIIPSGREADYPDSDAIDRIKTRFDSDKRALPWIVVTGKHTRTPRSFIQAVEDTKLDKVSLFANDLGRGNHYLVAESFVMGDSDVHALQKHQKDGKLCEHLKSLMTLHKDSTLKSMGKDAEALDALVQKNPKLSEENVAFTVYPSGGKNRVLVVYDAQRYVDLLEKGLMNPHASSKEGLLQSPATIPFNITQRAHEILKTADAVAPLRR